MGYPMAGHLARAGHHVTVFNRNRRKAEDWLNDFPGCLAETPAEVAGNADVVFACVGDDPDIRQVCLGSSGAFDAMQPGSVFVDHTTCSAQVVRELALEAGKRQLQFLDAPVSGGQQGAEKGVLTVMVGGEPSAFERARPLIQSYARAVTHMGESGTGQLTKMV
ncbi:MAG: NAD(P)-dependent oxidoreductase, partial [Chromatiales bacterium]|nr:NAD(P)-dependent oxidoreductase [Chromatiales bacterium]